jgi:hypothetical protein
MFRSHLITSNICAANSPYLKRDAVAFTKLDEEK